MELAKKADRELDAKFEGIGAYLYGLTEILVNKGVATRSEIDDAVGEGVAFFDIKEFQNGE